MPSAPASMASIAARTGSGCRPPRALRMVATWSMLTPRRSCESVGTFIPVVAFEKTPASAGHAVRGRHHLLGAKLRNDGVEMLEVIDLEIDGAVGEVR